MSDDGGSGRVESPLRLQHRPVPFVKDSEELSVDVGQLLTRIGPRGVHRGRDAVRHFLPVCAVLRPRRDRVAQLLAGDALERVHLTGLIQPAEKVVNERFSNMTTTT
jgi:hypothetical protein